MALFVSYVAVAFILGAAGFHRVSLSMVFPVAAPFLLFNYIGAKRKGRNLNLWSN